MRRAGWLLAVLALAAPAMAADPAAERYIGEWRVRGPLQGYCEAWGASTDGDREAGFHVALEAGGPRLLTGRWRLSQHRFSGAGLDDRLELRAGEGTARLRVIRAMPETFMAVFETPFEPGMLARPGSLEILTANGMSLIEVSHRGAAGASRAMTACLGGRTTPAR